LTETFSGYNDNIWYENDTDYNTVQNEHDLDKRIDSFVNECDQQLNFDNISNHEHVSFLHWKPKGENWINNDCNHNIYDESFLHVLLLKCGLDYNDNMFHEPI